jgi:hypothetical protein
MDEITASALTTFEVALDGSSVRLNLLDQQGRSAAVTLPTRCVNHLLMTVPRMVETALRNSQGDESLRYVHPMESFTLELASSSPGGGPQLILTITTGGGFAASFAGGEQVMTQLGHALIHDITMHPLTQDPTALRS